MKRSKKDNKKSSRFSHMKVSESAERLFTIERDLHEFKELDITSSPLKAAAFFIEVHCKDKNDRFMACNQFNKDPTVCHEEGKEVTNCVKDLQVIDTID
jgi:hypothetical protein